MVSAPTRVRGAPWIVGFPDPRFVVWVPVGMMAALSFVSFGGGALAWPIVGVASGLLTVGSRSGERVSRRWATGACLIGIAAIPAIAISPWLLPVLACLGYSIALSSGERHGRARATRWMRAICLVAAVALIARLAVPSASVFALCCLGLVVFVVPGLALDGWRTQVAGAGVGTGLLLLSLGRPAGGLLLMAGSCAVAFTASVLVHRCARSDPAQV